MYESFLTRWSARGGARPPRAQFGAPYLFNGGSWWRSSVLPASRRQIVRSRIVSFCRQDAGSTPNRHGAPRPDHRVESTDDWVEEQGARCQRRWRRWPQPRRARSLIELFRFARGALLTIAAMAPTP